MGVAARTATASHSTRAGRPTDGRGGQHHGYVRNGRWESC
jgi:hypothetical protein